MRTWFGVTTLLALLALVWAGSTLSKHVNEKAVARALERTENLQLWQDEDWRVTQQGVLVPDAHFVSHYSPGTL